MYSLISLFMNICRYLDDTLAVNIAHFLTFVKQIYLNERMLNITSDSCHFSIICTLLFAAGHLCYKYRQSTGKLVGPTINKLFIPCFIPIFCLIFDSNKLMVYLLWFPGNTINLFKY